MAIKRSFNINNSKSRTCLKCDRDISKTQLKDNTISQCQKCGQKHFVDIYSGSTCVLTVYERPELRRRHEDFKTCREVELALQLEAVIYRAEVAEANAKEWEVAAEGLANIVEGYKQLTTIK